MHRIALIAIMTASAGTAWAQTPPPCPRALGIVDRTTQAPLIYLPADPANPEACPIRLRTGVGQFWYGAWRTDWPGADQALLAYRQVWAATAGTQAAAARFDTVIRPGYSWHETIRNDGFEELNVAGAVHRTMKMTHEREGFDGNTYHSVITQWKDVETGMTIYTNYIHLAGAPEPGVAWDPIAIIGGK
jgi:hypothetical protein